MRSLLLAALLISAVTHSARADDKSSSLPNDGPLPLTAPFDEAQAKAAQETWAKYLGKSGRLEKNSIGMELVLIPPGRFRMGSPKSEAGRSAREGQADVTLTKAFYLGKTEVTQRQWHAVMGTTPWKEGFCVREGGTYPATYVRWEDAKAFCKKLSEMEKVVYRLPTEAEWEHACRGGTTTRYSCGGDESQLRENAWYAKNSADIAEEYAHEVGRKQPNPFGLYDVHGNVWEWCEDTFAEKLPGGTDPLASDTNAYRIFRGGGWIGDVCDCRSADRQRASLSDKCNFVGFRVARNSGQ